MFGLERRLQEKKSLICDPGEWAETSVDLSKDIVTIIVLVKKRLRSKEMILRLSHELREGSGFDVKELKRDRGYLVYISISYRPLASYLKGLHQTLDL